MELLWKHNNSLLGNNTCIKNMKNHFITILRKLKNKNITDEKYVW